MISVPLAGCFKQAIFSVESSTEEMINLTKFIPSYFCLRLTHAGASIVSDEHGGHPQCPGLIAISQVTDFALFYNNNYQMEEEEKIQKPLLYMIIGSLVIDNLRS